MPAFYRLLEGNFMKLSVTTKGGDWGEALNSTMKSTQQ